MLPQNKNIHLLVLQISLSEYTEGILISSGKHWVSDTLEYIEAPYIWGEKIVFEWDLQNKEDMPKMQLSSDGMTYK